MEYFLFERTGGTIYVVVATLVAYKYGCKGDGIAVPQNVNPFGVTFYDTFQMEGVFFWCKY